MTNDIANTRNKHENSSELPQSHCGDNWEDT